MLIIYSNSKEKSADKQLLHLIFKRSSKKIPKILFKSGQKEYLYNISLLFLKLLGLLVLIVLKLKYLKDKRIKKMKTIWLNFLNNLRTPN